MTRWRTKFADGMSFPITGRAAREEEGPQGSRHEALKVHPPFRQRYHDRWQAEGTLNPGIEQPRMLSKGRKKGLGIHDSMSCPGNRNNLGLLRRMPWHRVPRLHPLIKQRGKTKAQRTGLTGNS